MTATEAAIADLVTANHILAHEGIVDAFGHVSVRHPADPRQFLLSCSRSPEVVTAADIMTFGLDGESVVADDARRPYLERYIHAAIYAARPDVQSVVHSHSHEVLPFAVTRETMRPVTHLGAVVGTEVPVWDIRTSFGESTNLLVSDLRQGEDLARFLGARDAVLMRGHGSVVVADGIPQATLKAIYLSVNARVLMGARLLGDPVYLTDAEQAAARQANLGDNPIARSWQYFSSRVRARR